LPKMLVINHRDGYGDILLNTAPIHIFAQAGWEVHVATDKGEVFENNPDVAKVWQQPGVPQAEFDRVIRPHPAHIDYYEDETHKHWQMFFWSLVDAVCYNYALKIFDPERKRPRLYLSDLEVQWGTEQYEGLPHPWVALCFDANHPTREYPMPLRAMIASACWQRGWGTMEIGRAPVIGKHDLHRSQAGFTGFRQVVALLNAADLVFSVESGSLHSAAALKKRMVILPSHCYAHNVYPYDTTLARGCEVDKAIKPCYPCNARGEAHDKACFKEMVAECFWKVPQERVMAAAEDLLHEATLS
jgi:hypothetical protein